MAKIIWHNERRAIRELIPYEVNPRQITDKQAKDLKASLAKFGIADPIIINTDNMIIGGHQRMKILETLLGYEPDFQIDVRVPDRELSIDEVRELNVRLNKNVAEWDFDTLANEFEVDELVEWGFSPSELGITDEAESAANDVEHKSLSERFIIPPFSVLDARQGYWQERKRAWLALGIKSEIGRDDVLKRLESANKIQGSDMPLASVFDPVLCELAYRWFMPGRGAILDPFAGGSVRGIVASRIGRDYTGIDLSARQIEANNEQAARIVPDKPPRWIVGDSRNVKQLAAGEYDLIFSCPPYADLEVYSDDPADLSTLDYSDFIAAYRQIVADCVSMLKDDRFACFVVGDVRDKKGFYRNFPAHTIEAFQDVGMTLYNEAILVTAVGSLPIRVGKQFQGYRKLGKTHQNVLVFYKGDPKAIKQFGDVECGVDMTGGVPELIDSNTII